MDDKNKKATRLNFHKGSQSHNPSQANSPANININVEVAIAKLHKIVHKNVGITNTQGFLTDLRMALGIPDTPGASKYGLVTMLLGNDVFLQASLRITNHQANAEQYILHNANSEYNLSVVVRREMRRNTFKPHDEVRLDEYVYYGKRMAKVENPLTQIVNSIIGFLRTGIYEDTTGIAFKNSSPI